MARFRDYDIPVYTAAARHYHWWVAALIAVQIPIGFYMVYRGNEMVASTIRASRSTAFGTR